MGTLTLQYAISRCYTQPAGLLLPTCLSLLSRWTVKCICVSFLFLLHNYKISLSYDFLGRKGFIFIYFIIYTTVYHRRRSRQEPEAGTEAEAMEELLAGLLRLLHTHPTQDQLTSELGHLSLSNHLSRKWPTDLPISRSILWRHFLNEIPLPI